MNTTVHLKEDGAYTIQVPQDAAGQLHLIEGTNLDVSVLEEKLVLQRRRSKYLLEQLLKEHAEIADQLPEDREWIDAPRVGRELI